MTTVTIVLQREFGEKLTALASESHVWAVDTPSNRTVAEQHWAEGDRRITTFRFDQDGSNSDICLDILDTVDLHHKYSSEGPYQVVEVIGSKLNRSLKTALTKLGFPNLEKTAEGFRASRYRSDDVRADV